MQLVNTCGGFLVSLSFIANRGKIPSSNETLRIRRTKRNSQNYGAENVFQEAEELMSEMPMQAPFHSTPVSRIHEPSSPLDGSCIYNEDLKLDDTAPLRSLGTKKIRNIIESSLGMSKRRDDKKPSNRPPTPPPTPPAKVKNKYGPGRPLSMKIWMNIGTNDLITRCRRAKKFIEDGIPVMFKIEGQGATTNYITHAQVIVNTAMSVLSGVARLGGGLQQHANFLSQIFNPIDKPKSNKRDVIASSATSFVDCDTENRQETTNEEGYDLDNQEPSDYEDSPSNAADDWEDPCTETSSLEDEESTHVLQNQLNIDSRPPVTPFQKKSRNTEDIPQPFVHSTSKLKENRYITLDKGDKATTVNEGGPKETYMSIGYISKSAPGTQRGPYGKGDRQESTDKYWMDKAEKAKTTKEEDKKFITIKKSPTSQRDGSVPSTIKNDAMLQRFMAMRTGSAPKVSGTFGVKPTITAASPIPVPAQASPPVAPPAPVMPAVMPQYEFPQHSPSYVSSYEEPQPFQKYQWQPASNVYGVNPTPSYPLAPNWTPPSDPRSFDAPKSPVVPPPPKAGKIPNPGTHPRSRWITLDKSAA